MERSLSQLSEAAFRNRTSVVVCLSLISIVGFVGNTLVLLVFGFRFKPSATRIFVLFMATLDLITNTIALPLQIYTIRYAYNADRVSCRSLLAISTLSTQASGFVLVLVAMDRFRRICMPFRKQLHQRKALYLSTAIVFIAFVIFAPFVPYYGTHHLNITASAIRVRMCWSYDKYKDTIYPVLYKVTVGITFFVGLAVMIVCYISIGVRLWKEKFEGRTLKSQTGESRNTSEVEPVVDSLERGKFIIAQSNLQKTPGKEKSEIGSQHTRVQQSNQCNQLSGSGSSFSKSNSISREFEVLKNPEHSEVDIEGVGCASKGMQCESRENASKGTLCPPMTEVTPLQTPEDRSTHCNSSIKKSTVKITLPLKSLVKPEQEAAPVHTYSSRIRTHTTMMMCVLTVCYIINWLPHLIARTTMSEPVNLCDNFTDCGYNTYALSLRSYYLNSAINAFVYSFCNQRFRLECRELYRRFVRTRCARH